MSGAPKEKTPEMIKEELSSFAFINLGWQWSKAGRSSETHEGASRSHHAIKRYKDILKNQNKTINIVGKQGKLLERVEESEGFIETVGLSCSLV